jgi:cytochrome c-type biogenesis protein CcmH
MATFLVFAALMIAAALAFVAVPLVRHSRTTTADTARRLRALEEAHASGLLDADEYAAKRDALANAAPESRAPARRSRAAFASLLGVALLLPLSALLLYRLVGSPEALDPANLIPPQAEHSAEDMDKAIAGLAAKLKQQPDDAQGWALLGRAYQAMNRMEESRDALKQAHEHAPDDTDLAVEYAQSIALAAPDHRLAGDARALLDAVLKKDPKNQRALWLSGIADYQDEKYPEAIATWKTLLPLLDADSDVARSVRNEIADAEARRDGREPPAPEQAADEASTAAANAAPEAAPNGGAKLTVNVSLDPKLKDKLDGDATLFVFARAASGPPMPLAIQRLKASQLPLTVTLDDSMSMMPAMKLSKFPEVVVGARVSKTGNAMPQSGDLQTLTQPIASNRAEPIALTIDQVVP